MQVGGCGGGRPMITDQETNVVFVADTLELEFPAVYSGLRDILGRHEIPLRTIPGTRSIWCRDYMPIQVSEDRFVQFRYAPDYLTGKYRHLRADGLIGPRLPYVKNCEMSDIVLDGGNVVAGGGRVVVSDKVFAENPALKPSELLRELSVLLEVEQVVVIPTEPGDVVGHADGVIRFVDSGRVTVSDYRWIDPKYWRSLRKSLDEAGLEVVKIPYRPAETLTRGIPSAFGNYVNYLRVSGLIVIPSYGASEDANALETLSRLFPGCPVKPLDCRQVASEGGVLNCISWCIFDVGTGVGQAGSFISGPQGGGGHPP